MDNKFGLENILRAELTLLSKQILQEIHQKNLKELYHSVRKLHEKMAAIKVLSEQLTDDEIVSIITDKSIKNLPIENNEIKEKVQESAVETPEIPEEIIKDEVVEPIENERQKVDDIFKEVANISFVKKEKKPQNNPEITSNVKPATPVKETKVFEKSNVSSSKDISIGLHDRIAFISNLFGGNADAYNQTIQKLNDCPSYENALQVIYNEIKPKYDNWEGKDQYEFRLLQLLELKFN